MAVLPPVTDYLICTKSRSEGKVRFIYSFEFYDSFFDSLRN